MVLLGYNYTISVFAADSEIRGRVRAHVHQPMKKIWKKTPAETPVKKANFRKTKTSSTTGSFGSLLQSLRS